MRQSALTTSPLACALLILLSGCGGSSGSSSQAASTTAATTSGTSAITSLAPLAFRSLERGERTQRQIGPQGEQQVADSAPALASLWALHSGSSATPPQVDFQSERALGLFLGERGTLGHGIEVVAVAEVQSGSQQAIEVSYVRTQPSGTAAVGSSSAYHWVAVNRSGPFVFRDATPAPVVRPLQGVHGELVDLPTQGGGSTLGFLPDGSSDPLEIGDPSALLAANAHAGFSLLVEGNATPNSPGQSAASEALDLTTFQLDTLVETLRPVDRSGQRLLQLQRATYRAVGPQAAAINAAPLNAPLRVFGRLDAQGDLVVHAFRPAVVLGWSESRPLLGSDSVEIRDLDQRGAWALQSFEVRGRTPHNAHGEGRHLDSRLLSDLRQLATNANLRQQPTNFQPAQIYPDHPTQSLHFADAQGEVQITIWAGARVPAELTALMTRLRDLGRSLPQVRDLQSGESCAITQAKVDLASDQTSWNALWTRHHGQTRPVVPPALDFTKERLLAAYAGEKTTGGHSIRISKVVRIGQHFHLELTRTSPTGPAPSVITQPYHMAVLSSVNGQVWAEGQQVR